MCHRTFKNLLYANRNTFDHFTMVLHKYHQVTHRGGKVCVRDNRVLRNLTETLLQDVQVIKEFGLLASPVHFHPDDLDKVFHKYMYRVETMIGNEISRQLLEDLRLRGVNQLGSLRLNKRDRNQQVKLGEGVKGSSVPKKVVNVGKGTKKKRKRRKKKNW